MTQRQIQLRSHDADGACPSRRRPGLSRCEHTRINPHPPSPAIRPRGGAEAAHPFAHSRGKRRGAFAQPVRVAHPARAGVRRAGSTASERLASRRVVDIRPRRSSPTVRREYPPSHHPPSPRIPFPPGATRGRGENSPCQSRASERAFRRLRPGWFRADDETMSATPPMSHPTRPGLDDLPDPPAAPRKKKPTRSRVFPAPRGGRGDDARGDAAKAGVRRRGRV